MRRARDLRDHRNALRRKAIEERRQKLKNRTIQRVSAAHLNRKKRHQEKLMQDKTIRARQPLKMNFLPFDKYACNINEPIKVCHLIESLGMGGGQTMMMELVNGLNKYFEGKIQNWVVCPRPSMQKFEKALYQSYGVTPIPMREKEFPKFLVKHGVNVVLHHRLALSKCFRPLMPAHIKYVLMNHTYHQLSKVPTFMKCDFYVTVCNYLENETRWPTIIHPSRRAVILNGIENDYIDGLKDANLEGTFKTGRCHRLVQSKFKSDSIEWMNGKVAKKIEGHRHYILGHSGEAKKVCKKSKNRNCIYKGAVPSLQKKMSIIKDLDVYFYETFQNEGASIAILESLACGVPVLCKRYGGNAELIKDGLNGFVLKDRGDFLAKMRELHGDRELLNKMKENTLKDFNERLHVRHAASKFMQIFETVLKT